jgi:hypothetical protein
MLRYVLRSGAVGLRLNDFGNRVAVQVPAGTELFVVQPIPDTSPPDPSVMINVLWNQRSIAMFLIDLQERGVRCTPD